MTRINKDLLKKQIDVYLSWTVKNHNASPSYESYLDWFMRQTNKEDVLDITQEDLDLFFEIVDNNTNSQYEKVFARRALAGFRKFYMARSKNGKIRLGRGRPPANEQMERAGMLKAKLGDDISYREIGAVLNPSKPLDRSFVFHLVQRFKKLKQSL